jgi:hypothetical protein
MDLDDLLEPEIAIAAAATALVTSPRLQRVTRRAAVLGLSRLLAVSDSLFSTAQSLVPRIESGSEDGLEDIVARPGGNEG